MKWIVAIVFGCISLFVHAQCTPDSVFHRDLLIEDLEDLKKTILESHPDPYAFCGEAKFEAAYEKAVESVPENLTLADFAKIVAEFLNVMQDSHTSLDYGYLQEIQFNGNGYYLPLSLRKTEMDSHKKPGIVVGGDWTQGIPKGSAIISINNIPIEDICDEAMSFACIEGNSVTAQRSIAVALVPIVCGLKQQYDSTNTICYIPPGSDQMKVASIDGIQRKAYNTMRREKEKQKPSWMPELKIDDTLSLAVLKIPTFSPSSGKKYAKAIRRSFQELNKKNINNLVIDIRGNGGGSSAWVEYLYSFLDTSGYNTPDNVIGRNSQLAMDRNKLFHSGFVQLIVKLFFKKDEDVISYQRISELPFGGQDTVYFQEPTKQKLDLVFRGKSFLLINGLTASAGVDFTHAFKIRQRGEIIGEQCLGPVTGTWGNPASYTMTNTGIRMTIATIRYNYDRSFRYESSAIEPDHHITVKPQDLFQDKDTHIEYIKTLLNQHP